MEHSKKNCENYACARNRNLNPKTAFQYLLSLLSLFIILNLLRERPFFVLPQFNCPIYLLKNCVTGFYCISPLDTRGSRFTKLALNLKEC